jgi:energy-coupling factor transport system substrate-specific component
VIYTLEKVYFLRKNEMTFDTGMVLALLILIGLVTWLITEIILGGRARETETALELANKQIEMGNESVLALAKALFSKDRRTGEHCHRVAYYAEKLARAYGFSDEGARNLKKAAILHDIGKIAIPDAILNKPSKLTPEEYEIMKTHTTAGAEILKGFTMIDNVADGAKYHHERYDGKGYPEGLAGEDIPLYGRIIAVADTFDAMTANRVYRGALDMDQVMEELEKGKGTQFDPYLDTLFMKLINEGEISPEKTFEMFKNRDLITDIE